MQGSATFLCNYKNQSIYKFYCKIELQLSSQQEGWNEWLTLLASAIDCNEWMATEETSDSVNTPPATIAAADPNTRNGSGILPAILEGWFQRSCSV